MNEKMKILDDFIFDLDVSYSVKDGFIFVFPSTPYYLLRKIKNKAKVLGISYRSLKDGYVKFYFNEKLKRQNLKSEKIEVEESQSENIKEFSIEELFKRINVIKQTLLNLKKYISQLMNLFFLGLEIENINSKHLE